MATVSSNDLTSGLRGRFGKFFVFRTLRGKTVATHAPRKPDSLLQSNAQRHTFRTAAAWAVQALKDDCAKQYYTERARERNLPNAYTAAVQHICRKLISMNRNTPPSRLRKFNARRNAAQSGREFFAPAEPRHCRSPSRE